MTKFVVLSRTLDGLLKKVGEINANDWKAARREAMAKYWGGLNGAQMVVASPTQMKRFWNRHLLEVTKDDAE